MIKKRFLKTYVSEFKLRNLTNFWYIQDNFAMQLFIKQYFFSNRIGIEKFCPKHFYCSCVWVCPRWKKKHLHIFLVHYFSTIFSSHFFQHNFFSTFISAHFLKHIFFSTFFSAHFLQQFFSAHFFTSHFFSTFFTALFFSTFFHSTFFQHIYFSTFFQHIFYSTFFTACLFQSNPVPLFPVTTFVIWNLILFNET